MAAAVKTRTSLDELLDVISYVSKEQWVFDVSCGDSGVTSFSTQLFDGTLELNSDGTWKYFE